MQTAVQLYTLRDLDEPLARTAERVADAGFDGVQFAKLHYPPEPEFAGTLADLGLGVAGAHVDVDLASDPDGLREAYAPFDCPDFVVPSYEESAFTDRERAREAATHLGELAAGFEDARLHYHNHTFEFVDLGAGTGFDAFAEALDPSVGLEIDTGLAYHGGADPVSLLERYADRVSLVHLTDSVRGNDDLVHADPGEGEVDVEACIDAAAAADAEWLIAEVGPTEDPLRTLERAADVLVD